MSLENELLGAIAAARTGGQILLRHFRQPHQVNTKRDYRDIVTEADHASDKAIQDVLRSATPSIPLLTEESGGSPAPRYWCIDPLDGTMHYAFGMPNFSVSIALIENNQPTLGVIYCPVQDETYTALQGGSAFCNGKRIQVSQRAELADALLAFRATEIRRALPGIQALIEPCRSLSVAGSTAQDFCLMAAGYIDGMAKSGQSPWDYAAGLLILQEAGGKTTTWDGKPVTPAETNVSLVATNGLLHDKVLAALRTQ